MSTKESLESIEENLLRSKSKSQIRLKPVKMKTLTESSVKESTLGMTLKIQLAQNITHPDRPIITECAYLMEDMLRAVENGQTQLTPRAKHRIYRDKPLSFRG
mgnify:FL=1